MPSPDLILDDHYKEDLAHYDFKFFLERDIQQNDYDPEDVKQIHQTYQATLKELEQERQKNPKQYHYWLEGQVRLMFHGKGFLPGFFRLDGWTRGHTITDFESYGEAWAYFHLWQKHERRKFKRKKVWGYITKTGAVLAIALTLVKIWEAFFKDSV